MMSNGDSRRLRRTNLSLTFALSNRASVSATAGAMQAAISRPAMASALKAGLLTPSLMTLAKGAARAPAFAWSVALLCNACSHRAPGGFRQAEPLRRVLALPTEAVACISMLQVRHDFTST